MPGIEERMAQEHEQVISLYHRGEYAEALRLAEEQTAMVREALGEAHPDYATCLNNLAFLYQAMGEYARAEPLYRRALDICLGALGEAHPSFATSLNNLAGLYEASGDYMRAEPLYRRALEIDRQALGESHPDFATDLNNLAFLYWATGDYARAEPLYRQALEIRLEALGEAHPQVAQSLNNLAALHRAKGEYAPAEALYRRALEVRRRVLGESHPDYATSLNNLAFLYWATGDYARAGPFIRQALEIDRQALGESHPDFATDLNNLGSLCEATGDYGQAEALYRRALEVRRRVLGESHPDYAASLNNLAFLYHATGDYAQAEPLFSQAAEVLRRVLGEDSPSFATILSNLALLCEVMGEYARAEALCRRVMDIRCQALGESHPDYATSLNNLALLYAGRGRGPDALALMTVAATIDDRVLGQVFTIGSATRRAAFLHTIAGNLAGLLSLAAGPLREDPSAARAALDLVLRRKAIGAEAHATQHEAVLGGKYPALAPQLHQLFALRRESARLSWHGPGLDGPAAHQRLLADLERDQDRLEADLARQIPEMNLERGLARAGRGAVALALPEETMLVEFARYNVYDFVATAKNDGDRWEPARPWQPARYVAFLLPAGQPDDVRMIELGPADDIDRLIADFRTGVTRESERRGGRDLGLIGLHASPGEPSYDPGAELRCRVFDPLREALGGRTRLFIAPDGDLSRLPLGVLPDGDGLLLDRYRITYLASGRDVVRFGAGGGRTPAAPVIVGGPDYDYGLGTPAPSSEQAVEVRGMRSRDRLLFDIEFPPLPAAGEEGREVAQQLGDYLGRPIEPLLGRAAIEARLKTIESPWLLHLATHGFFLEDQIADHMAELRRLDRAGFEEHRELHLENPMLRSGLALAGANWMSKKFTPPPEAEDGLLTAEDVAGLNLLDTKLVVLSACETGLGKIHVGEGVFGLRRAFVLAGAKALVMSLWKVPDETTRRLMLDFYHRILAGEPRAEALWQAQLAVRKDKPHPFDWGAFILQGDPGPLRMRPAG
jgi:CHAT domain-containing protein/tetratricopeptide (TPR) repeat protein